MAELLAGPDRDIEIGVRARPSALRAGRRASRFDLRDLGHQPQRAAVRASTCCGRSRRANPAGQVLLISGFGTLETAIDAVRAGAFDYISKPFNIGEVKATVERALAQAGRRPSPGRAARARSRPPGLIGRTAPMLDGLQADRARGRRRRRRC